jgi:hypothetical protein
MVLLGLTSYMLNFDVVIRWWLIFQEHLDRVHPIIHRILLWLINDHQILSDCFIAYFADLTEALYNFSIMTSGEVGALEEAIHPR